jgi:hypothetical protein
MGFLPRINLLSLVGRRLLGLWFYAQHSHESRFAILARIGQGGLLLLAVTVMVSHYPIEFQGLFFVFLSLGALFPLADFGLSYAVVQTGSHLKGIDDFGAGASFARKARIFGVVISLFSMLWIGLFGSTVIHVGIATAGDSIILVVVWWAFAAASSALQWANFELARIEGLRSSLAAWRARLLQEWLGGAALVGALVLNLGLWALVVQALVRFAVAIAVVLLSKDTESSVFNNVSSPSRFSWRLEVWPFQWRIGLSAVAGYLIFQAFNPILLIEQGPASAGRFGLSLSFMNMLLMVTTAWPLSRSARWTAWLSQGNRLLAQADFMSTLRASSVMSAIAGFVFFLCLALAMQLGVPFAQRSADLLTTALLLLLGFVHHLVACVAVLLRAQRQEPFLRVTVFGAFLNAVVVAVVSKHGELWAVAASALAVSFVGLAFTVWLYGCFQSEVRAHK